VTRGLALAGLLVVSTGAALQGPAVGPDDTPALQSRVDALPPGGTLQLSPRTYWIDARRGLRLKDNMTLDLGGAVLTAVNVSHEKCRILYIEGGKKIVIRNGTLVGSRSGSPSFGMGILASDAQDLVVEDLQVHDNYYDGILLTGNTGCRRVRISRVVSSHNRRTGLAVVAAQDVTVEDSTFQESQGQSPQAGANCEPNKGGGVRHVLFRRCIFSGNAGVGVYIHRALGDGVSDASVLDSKVQDNEAGIVASGVDGVTLTGNEVSGHHEKGKSAIAIGEDTTGAKVVANDLEDNFRGILAAGATGVEIRSNTVVGQGVEPGEGAGESGDGIVCMGLRPPLLQNPCVVAQNTIRGHPGSGIVARLVTQIELLDNIIDEVGERGILLIATTASEVRGNQVSRVGLEAPGTYDAIELSEASADNRVVNNTCTLGPGARQAVMIDPGCPGNTLDGNVVVPR
jgi:nitrous oxidase accessory protein NosD